MFRLLPLVLSLVGFIAGTGSSLATEPNAYPCAGLVAGPTRTVTRIIDAETVALDDGSELRLIGALAPRAIDVGADPGAWPLEVAAQAELMALILAKPVELLFGGEHADRHGRLLAHAFWSDGGRGRWVQAHLLEQGLARAYVQAGNRTCADELLDAERTARASHRGLWADAAYAVRSAGAPLELSRYRSTFQVVEGQIERVAEVRGTIYLNFDSKRRGAFAVSLRRGDRGTLGTYARDPKTLAGKRARVRGWIEQRQGPTINLSAAGLLEVLDGPPSDVGLPASPRAGAKSGDVP